MKIIEEFTDKNEMFELIISIFLDDLKEQYLDAKILSSC